MLLYDARLDTDKPAEQLYVWRLMVDARHQRRGFGRWAINWVMQEARRMGLPEVALSHVAAEGHAGAFYEKLGFRYTGERVGDELEMVLAVPEMASAEGMQAHARDASTRRVPD